MRGRAHAYPPGGGQGDPRFRPALPRYHTPHKNGNHRPAPGREKGAREKMGILARTEFLWCPIAKGGWSWVTPDSKAVGGKGIARPSRSNTPSVGFPSWNE